MCAGLLIKLRFLPKQNASPLMQCGQGKLSIWQVAAEGGGGSRGESFEIFC